MRSPDAGRGRGLYWWLPPTFSLALWYFIFRVLLVLYGQCTSPLHLLQRREQLSKMSLTKHRTSFTAADLAPISSALAAANGAFLRHFPGETNRRQPAHTVYGGGHLFKADSAVKLGVVALRTLDEYAPDAVSFAKAFQLEISSRMPSFLTGHLCRRPSSSLRFLRPEILRRTPTLWS